MAVQIKHVNGMVHLTKQTSMDGMPSASSDQTMRLTEEEAIHVLGKQHSVIMECKQYNKEAKKKEIEELEFKIKKLKENLL